MKIGTHRRVRRKCQHAPWTVDRVVAFFRVSANVRIDGGYPCRWRAADASDWSRVDDQSASPYPDEATEGLSGAAGAHGHLA